MTSPVVSVASELCIHVRVEHSGPNTSHMKIGAIIGTHGLIDVELLHCLVFQTSSVVSVASEPSLHVRVEHSEHNTSHRKIDVRTQRLA